MRRSAFDSSDVEFNFHIKLNRIMDKPSWIKTNRGKEILVSVQGGGKKDLDMWIAHYSTVAQPDP